MYDDSVHKPITQDIYSQHAYTQSIFVFPIQIYTYYSYLECSRLIDKSGLLFGYMYVLYIYNTKKPVLVSWLFLFIFRVFVAGCFFFFFFFFWLYFYCRYLAVCSSCMGYRLCLFFSLSCICVFPCYLKMSNRQYGFIVLSL